MPMLRNHLNPAVLFGLLMLGVSLFVLSIGGQLWQEYIQRGSYEYGGNEPLSDFYARIFFIVFGIILTFVSVAFILRYRWARIVMLALFYIATIAWTGFILFLVADNNIRNTEWIFFGLCAVVFGLLIFCILFLNNEWVISHWDSDYVDDSQHRKDILDM